MKTDSIANAIDLKEIFIVVHPMKRGVRVLFAYISDPRPDT